MCSLSGVLLSETLAKVFLVAKEAKCKRLCVYRINGWRRSPAGSPRQTVHDRGKKLALNQRALCSEAPQQTEAFSG